MVTRSHKVCVVWISILGDSVHLRRVVFKVGAYYIGKCAASRYLGVGIVSSVSSSLKSILMSLSCVLRLASSTIINISTVINFDSGSVEVFVVIFLGELSDFSSSDCLCCKHFRLLTKLEPKYGEIFLW